MEGILEEARLCQERLEELKVAAGQARVVGDLGRLQGYTQQLELYQAKQQELLRERDDHQRLIRWVSQQLGSTRNLLTLHYGLTGGPVPSQIFNVLRAV